MSKTIAVEGNFQGSLDLKQLVGKIDNSVKLPFNIGLTKLHVEASSEFYSFHATANGEIDLGGFNLSFPTIDCDLSIQEKKLSNFNIEVLFQVGTEDQGCLFGLNSSYTDQTWTFSGASINPLEMIALSSLLKDIMNIFGLKLPSSFPKLNLSSMMLNLEIQDGKLHSFYGSFSLDELLKVEIPLTNGGSGWVANISLDYQPNFNLLTSIPLVNKIIDKASLETLHIGYSTQKGFNFSAALQIGDQKVEISKDEKASEENTNAPPLEALLATSKSDDAPQISYPIQKTIGPLHFDKIGLGWNEGDLEISLSLSAALGALKLDLMGFTVGVPLDNPSPDQWHYALNGLGITYQAGSIEISGGLYKENVTTYNGELTLKAFDVGLMALGSLSVEKDLTSLFIFAFLQANMGGPPCFFVTGLSMGFGYNRGFRPPAIEEIASFPLVAGISDPKKLIGNAQAGTSGALSNALTTLSAFKDKQGRPCLQPKDGEYWIAAGVEFISYELITTNALLVVEMGHDFEIMILGKAFASLPPKLGFAYVELNLEVIFNPGGGFVSAEARLTSNSYLLDRSCHLTGGFAFNFWFGSNPHAGDFVLTLGGYHPKFRPPAHYPNEPRIGFNWIVDRHVSIKGGTYFAMTPSCMMGGGSLEAVYKSGDLEAWFKVQADFLIFWKPFYFIADASISLGVSYRLHIFWTTTTLKIEIGAKLHLEGPPMRGYVHVQLWFISFTVAFGPSSNSQDTEPLSWNKFAELLPKGKTGTDACQIKVSSGLLGEYEEKGEKWWIIRGDEFSFSMESQIPLTTIEFSSQKISGSEISIRPMQKTKISSQISLEIKGNQCEWDFSSKKAKAPPALWGSTVTQPNVINPNEKPLENQLLGLEKIAPKGFDTTHSTNPIDKNKLGYFSVVDAYLPLSGSSSPEKMDPQQNQDALNIIEESLNTTSDERGKIYSALHDLMGFEGDDQEIDHLAKTLYGCFETNPLIGSL